ncbi:MAG: SGNH/GDSL hydrolase family protein, partial [Pedococcus sp.]
PNVAGHRDGYTPLVGAQLTGSTAKVSAATVRTAVASSARLADQQRRYAAVDSAIAPEVFRRPDLGSPRVKAAARRAGVDLSSRASIDAADRAWSQRQAQELAAR